MKAYHFLKADMTAGMGNEPAWKVGEERTVTRVIKLCERGYHHSPSWYDALGYAPGPMACIVEVSDPVESDDTKGVSRTRKLVAARNVEHTIRLWVCDCAERALLREREAGREPDLRSWRAIEVARRFANGAATAEELDAARAAAWDAARDARAAAREAVWDAWDAAGDAACPDEVEWQRSRLDFLMEEAFGGTA